MLTSNFNKQKYFFSYQSSNLNKQKYFFLINQPTKNIYYHFSVSMVNVLLNFSLPSIFLVYHIFFQYSRIKSIHILRLWTPFLYLLHLNIVSGLFLHFIDLNVMNFILVWKFKRFRNIPYALANLFSPRKQMFQQTKHNS